jgi:hypothetical protein
MKVVHLTHTDIRYDNRIRKEIECIEDINYFTVFIGCTTRKEKAQESKRPLKSYIFSFNMFSDFFKYNNRLIYNIFYLLEITLRFLWLCFKLKPRVIHCHDTMVLFSGFLYKLFFNNVYLIYDAHELESNKNGQSNFQSKVTYLIEYLCWSRIDKLISVSNSIINWYELEFGPKDSACILNSPIGRINSKNNYLKDYFNLNSNDLVFLYLGDFCLGRSIDNILEIFKEINPKFHVVFLGFGDLHDLINHSATKFSNIHYHPAVEHENVVKISSSADFGLCLIENVSLSDYLCLPNKYFEYVLSGLPVLSSDLPELNFYNKKFNLGISTELTRELILENIIRVSETSFPPFDFQNSELSWEFQETILSNIYLDISLNK